MELSEANAYLKTLLFIASADNSVDDIELESIFEIGSNLGLSSEELTIIQDDITRHTENIESIIGEIKKEQTKIALIRDLLTLCYVDGEYSVVEQSGMSEICGMLNLSDDVLRKIENEVETQRINNIKAVSLGKSIIGFPFHSSMTRALEIGKNGAVFAGQKLAEGGTLLAHSLTKGIGAIGTKISFSIEIAKKAKEENRQLREKLKTTNISEAVKQKVILQLNSKIVAISSQLKEEKQRNMKNEELIFLLQAQIDDLSATIDVAQNIKAV